MERLLFRIENLSFSYAATSVFSEFSATSNARVVVLRGPSGCGKTTLLKLLSGQLEPSGATHVPPTDNACLIVQEDGLFPWLTGIQNLIIGDKANYEAVTQHPTYFLIKDFVDKKAYTLSFGQRRKIELVRAFVGRFRVLYLDEPFNFIDPESRIILANYINSGAPSGLLIVMTTHYDADIIGIESDIFSFDGALPVSGSYVPAIHKLGVPFI